MQFHRAIAAGTDLEAVCREAAAEVRSGLGPGSIDLAIVFASPRYGSIVDRLPVLLHDALGARALVGCSGATVVDDGGSLEGRHGIALLAGRVPHTRVDAVAISHADLPSPDAPPVAWRALLPESPVPRSGMVVLGEPFHGDPAPLLAGLDYGFPGVTKVGGIASGSRHPEGHALFCGRTTHRSGAVVLALAGDVEVAAIVAPGCRAFGRVGLVTKTRDNRLLAIDGLPARTFVSQQLATLSGDDRQVAQASPLLLGLAADPFEAAGNEPREFLVRSILGVDAQGELVTSQHLPVGRSVRLLMRDAASGAEQLRQRLGDASPDTAMAAVLFQCLGRESADHAAFAAAARGVPLVGFHCNGEIGPLGDTTQMHSFTTAIGLFRSKGGR